MFVSITASVFDLNNDALAGGSRLSCCGTSSRTETEAHTAVLGTPAEERVGGVHQHGVCGCGVTTLGPVRLGVGLGATSACSFGQIVVASC